MGFTTTLHNQFTMGQFAMTNLPQDNLPWDKGYSNIKEIK